MRCVFAYQADATKCNAFSAIMWALLKDRNETVPANGLSETRCETCGERSKKITSNINFNFCQNVVNRSK